MTLKPHKKHTKLSKPLGGKFHRNEFALIGAPCSVIQQLSEDLVKQLPQLQVGYADASHNHEETRPTFSTIYTDKISHHASAYVDPAVEYQFRNQFQSCDLVLINGNHFLAERQIVLIHEKKRESLSKKLDRLTQVLFFVLEEGQDDIWDFLKEAIPNHQQIPRISIQEVTQMASIIQKIYQESIPTLKGLVLAGGESLRMGQDKGAIDYHGKPQREYAADLLNQVCKETFLSVRNEDVSFETKYPLITDQFMNLGPYGGILSAFRSDPNSAWLVAATDIPMLDLKTLQQLVTERNPGKMATCFHNPDTNFPEPLITIWEPRAYSRLLHFLSMGHSCPRKALINSDVAEIQVERKEVLSNVNTPEELEAIREKVHG